MTNNAWIEDDYGLCRNYCNDRRDFLNEKKECQCCYENRICKVRGCDNQAHCEGDGGCSLHELQWAREEADYNLAKYGADGLNDAAQIALWTDYVAADVTLPDAVTRATVRGLWMGRAA